MKITNYNINEDMSVDGDDHVIISHMDILSIPIQFNVVSGDFYCRANMLTSLKGAPRQVGGNFYCDRLTSLDGIGIVHGEIRK